MEARGPFSRPFHSPRCLAAAAPAGRSKLTHPGKAILAVCDANGDDHVLRLPYSKLTWDKYKYIYFPQRKLVRGPDVWMLIRIAKASRRGSCVPPLQLLIGLLLRGLWGI